MKPVADKEMWMENKRAASFGASWPFKHKRSRTCPAKVVMRTVGMLFNFIFDANQMAMAGFFHDSSEDSPDNVTCFMCNKSLDGWERTDDPIQEHKKHSPACPFMNLHLEENRFKTFQFWPHKGFKSKPKDFARAGFVFAPDEDCPDMVKCISCNKCLDGWEKDDIAMDEHRAHSKKCAFIRAFDLQKQEEEKEETQGEEDETQPDKVEEKQERVPLKETQDNIPSKDEGKAQAKGNGKKRKSDESKEVQKTKKRSIEDIPVDDSTTVEEYFRAFCDMQVQALVFAGEKRIAEFRKSATQARQQIACI
eukprot:m.89550 g.89550  ORF g.89550 m.89550 type:complete len:308 (+) comp13228_c0_seq2:83-1006(+)